MSQTSEIASPWSTKRKLVSEISGLSSYRDTQVLREEIAKDRKILRLASSTTLTYRQIGERVGRSAREVGNWARENGIYRSLSAPTVRERGVVVSFNIKVKK
jgi:hypothetical protein